MIAVAVLAGATSPAASRPDRPSAEGALRPQRIDLRDAEPVRDFTPGIEEPALYELLRAVRRAGQPSPAPAEPLDRHGLTAEPQVHRGKLLWTEGRFWDARRIRLAGLAGPDDVTIWSTRALELHADQPIQILSLTEPGGFGRLEKIRCIGYFYKIRRERAARPDRSGRRILVDVPVLVGWVLPPPRPEKPSGTVPPLSLVLGATAGLFGLLLLVRLTARRRKDWRNRLRRAKTSAARGEPEQCGPNE